MSLVARLSCSQTLSSTDTAAAATLPASYGVPAAV